MSMLARQAAISISVLLALTACERGGGPAASPETPTTLSGMSPTVAWGGGQRVPLGVRAAHPDGAVVELAFMQSGETQTVIGVRLVNATDDWIRLNEPGRGYILLGDGGKLQLSPPRDPAELRLGAGEARQGELVFVGRLPPASSAVLVLNDAGQAEGDTRFPSFRINLPMQSDAGAAQ